MTPYQFRSIARLTFGESWRKCTAGALGVSVRNVEFWTAGPGARSKPIPPGVARDLLTLASAACQADPMTASRFAAALAETAETVEILRQVTGAKNPEI